MRDGCPLRTCIDEALTRPITCRTGAKMVGAAVICLKYLHKNCAARGCNFNVHIKLIHVFPRREICTGGSENIFVIHRAIIWCAHNDYAPNVAEIPLSRRYHGYCKTYSSSSRFQCSESHCCHDPSGFLTEYVMGN